ncbi:MAG: class I SAM-dependent methyltransferase [Moorellaceae bacterium]
MADQGTEGLLSSFLRSQRLKAVRPYIRGRVLDVGCGAGALADMVAPDFYLGVDIDEQSLAKARKLHPNHCFQSVLPPAESAFDTVVALAVIEHVPDPAAFLYDLAARLKKAPGSWIVCTTPHPSVHWIHTAGARVGLFSRHASKEHRSLLDRTRLDSLGKECGLKLVIYKRFLFGTNQLALFRRTGDCS